MANEDKNVGDRFTWQPGDLKPVEAEKSVELVEHYHRYHLMKHDPDKRNHAYLYYHTTIVGTVSKTQRGKTAAVDILCTTGETDSRAEYLAKYQRARLQSGMEARGDTIYYTKKAAEEQAMLVVDYLTNY